MALLAESKRVAAEFNLTDDDVRKVTAEFVNELGA
jgi:hexokinase